MVAPMKAGDVNSALVARIGASYSAPLGDKEAGCCDQISL